MNERLRSLINKTVLIDLKFGSVQGVLTFESNTWDHNEWWKVDFISQVAVLDEKHGIARQACEAHIRFLTIEVVRIEDTNSESPCEAVVVVR